MIVGTFELWPGGDPRSPRRRVLGRVVISNVGGTSTTGEYEAIFFKAESRVPAASPSPDSPAPVFRVFKAARVKGFRRKKYGIWYLALGALLSVIKPQTYRKAWEGTGGDGPIHAHNIYPDFTPPMHEPISASSLVRAIDRRHAPSLTSAVAASSTPSPSQKEQPQ